MSLRLCVCFPVEPRFLSQVIKFVSESVSIYSCLLNVKHGMCAETVPKLLWMIRLSGLRKVAATLRSVAIVTSVLSVIYLLAVEVRIIPQCS